MRTELEDICTQSPDPLLQTSSLVAVFLASLGQMGGNAHIAGRVLKGLSDSGPGRVALRSGALRWHDRISAPGSRGQDALQWAASSLLLSGAGRHMCPRA